jgi:hypothetical protein
LEKRNFSLVTRAERHLLQWCCLGAAILFCLGVAFDLNGSSVGMWRELLGEPGKPRGLILSEPARIRVDEWAISTPSMLSQARQRPPFPIENASLGAGRAPLIMNVPVAHYTALFRPQFWGFFVFDFSRGFAFYWWAKFFGLLTAAGWALRQLGVRSRLLAIFGAVWVLFSNYVQWWFSSPTLLPEMLASWFVCLGCATRFFKDRQLGKTIFSFLGFVFFGTNFVLCLYPPYQVPLGVLFIAILVGVWWEEVERGSTARGFVLLVSGLAAIGLVLFPFWLDVRSTLQMVAHTVYPGARRSAGGELSLFKLLSGVLGFFESEHSKPDVYDNICEASNFYPLWPAAAFVIVTARIRSKLPVSPLMTSLLIFLVAMSLYALLPIPQVILRATFLNFATEKRALLALGIANILMSCLFLDRYRSAILPGRASLTAGIILWLGLILMFWAARIENRTYFSDAWNWVQPLVISATILLLFFWERLRYRWLPVSFGLLLIFSNALINPVMRGLSPLLDSVAFTEIRRITAADPEGKWIVYHTRYFAQLVKATGAVVLNGTKSVPDLDFFHELDPDRSSEFAYNRYANIGCEMPRLSREVSASVVYPDFYILYLPPDLPILKEAGYRYILIPNEWPAAASYGYELLEKISPGDLWVYKGGK